MHSSTLTPDSAHWNHPAYEVKVRGTIYLWGSAGVTVNLDFAKPLILHIRNDLFGEVITVETQVASGVKTSVATLQPGECVSMPIQNISGVLATCTLTSVVYCLIKDAS